MTQGQIKGIQTTKTVTSNIPTTTSQVIFA
jgi:hypothetical protein